MFAERGNATRYGRLVDNFPAGICGGSAISYVAATGQATLHCSSVCLVFVPWSNNVVPDHARASTAGSTFWVGFQHGA